MKCKPMRYRLPVIALMLVAGQQASAACAVVSGGDANIMIEVEQSLSIGTVTGLEQGDVASIKVGADGMREVPSNVFIGNNNSTNFGDSYTSARLNISGLPDCSFTILIGFTPDQVSNVTLQGVDGTSLSSAYSGATGTLSSTGIATVQLGATVTIDATQSSDLSGSITVDANFLALSTI